MGHGDPGVRPLFTTAQERCSALGQLRDHGIHVVLTDARVQVQLVLNFGNCMSCLGHELEKTDTLGPATAGVLVKR